MPLVVSIIIPTYNSERTIKRALESIVEQTYEHKEVWVIDGNSSDKTCEIVSNYATQFRFIHYLSEKDNGIYDAMNKGISRSSGDWLYFLGSDDKLVNNKVLSKIFTNPELVNNDVIYGKVNSNRWNGEFGKQFRFENFFKQNICHQAIFFKRRVFTVTGKFNTKYKAHADWDHNIKWFTSKRIKKIFINDVIAEYSDGGYSSKGDMVFAFKKELIYWFYFRKKTAFKEKVQWLQFLIQTARLYNIDYLIKKLWIRAPFILVILIEDLIRGHMVSGKKVADNSEYFKPVVALKLIKKIVPKNESFILVDQNEWGAAEKVCNRQVIPFCEQDGLYWGPPLDDSTAINEIEQQRCKGFNFIIFASPAFWWLDYYTGMYSYLKSNYKCILNNDRLIGFSLQKNIGANNDICIGLN